MGLIQQRRRPKTPNSASIKPTNSSVEAEAEALLMAVQQIRRLGYKQVTFLSDCKPMVKELDQWKTVTTIKDSP